MSTPSKFGQLTSGTTVKRYSGGPLDDNFKVIGKPMWSPYQIRSDESKDVKTTFEFFTKEKKKLYKGPDGDPTTSLTLPELCHHVFNDAETGGVDTCLYAPDNNGNVWCMTKHYTRVTYEETKIYVDLCLSAEPAKVFDALGVETPASILARAKTYDDQAKEDSAHLWRLIVSYVDPSLLTGLFERLEEYGNRGPGLLLWMSLMDEVTSGSPQAMDGILEKFKKIQLSDYPGENVRLMVNDIQASYNLLKSGQCLPTTVSSMVTTKFLLCQVEEFRAFFFAPSVTIDKEERGLMGKDNLAMIQYQSTPSGVKALCELALTQYKRLSDNGRWPPSQTVPRKQADTLPSAFHAATFPAAFQALSDELKLIRKDISGGANNGPRDHSKTKCYKCGKIGHIRPNCPDKSPSVGKADSWKETPPTPGSPETITKDGREWFWCGKCRGGDGRWSTTHSTSTHKGAPSASPGANPTVTFSAVANLASMDAPSLSEPTCDDFDDESGQLHYGPFGFVASCDDRSVDWSLLGDFPHTYTNFLPPPDDQSVCLSGTSSCALLSSCVSHAAVDWQSLGPHPSVSVAPVPAFDFHPPVSSSAAWFCDVSSCDVTMADATSTFGSFIGDAGDLDNDAPLWSIWDDDDSRYRPTIPPVVSFFDPTSVTQFDVESISSNEPTHPSLFFASATLPSTVSLPVTPIAAPGIDPCCSTCSNVFCRLISAYSPLHN
jgi:Zinc knuckle